MSDLESPLPPVEPGPQVAQPTAVGEHTGQRRAETGRRRRRKTAAPRPEESAPEERGVIEVDEGHIDFRA
jgi:hypothetical protein